MTRLLTTAQDEAELEAAISGGADIVELRSAVAGQVTPLPVARVRALVAMAKGRVLLRTVCARVPAGPDALAVAALELDGTGVDEVAVLLPAEDMAGSVAAFAGRGWKARLIAILGADRKPVRDELALLADAGFSGVCLDVLDHVGGRLLDHMPPADIGAFVDAAHGKGLTVGLAGALEAPDVPRLVALGADTLGFRGVLLDSATGRPDAGRIAGMAALIAASVKVDATTSHRGPSADRIFVRDFVVDMQIGAYRSEHGRLQKVRFDVVVDLRAVSDMPRDMRNVFSYDLILDGIRGIAARGHVDLVETVAEDLARIALAHPSAMAVQVRVEKIELGAGGVGVEIRRSRA